MLLKKVRLRNFRGFKDIEVSLAPTTVLIGENNSGKTSLLEALRLALWRHTGRSGGTFDAYDYHLATENTQSQSAQPISIALTFEQEDGVDLPDEFIQALGQVIVTDDLGRSLIVFRVTSGYDTAASDFITDWQFLDAAGNPLPPRTKRPQVLSEFLRLFPVFYLSAFRDAVREFRTGSYWAPFIRNPAIPEDLRESLQEQIGNLNSAVLQAHTSLQTVKAHLANVQKIVPIAESDPVDIEALPARITDLLGSTQVSVKTPTGVPLPLARHGAGTQSLSVLFLFQAYLSAMLARQYDPLTTPILALEEPEAHLHPCATRSVWSALEAIPGQKITATHSGDLIARAPLTAIRRLYTRHGTTSVGVIPEGLLSTDEERKVRYHVTGSRGELLFARCWLLCEGETEQWILEGMAHVLDRDLDRFGVRLVPYRWSGHVPLLKVANALGISWLLLADGDSQGNSSVRGSRPYLNGAAEEDRIFQLAEPNIELHLCKEGFGEVFEAHIAPQKKRQVTSRRGTDAYWAEVLRARDDTPKPQVAQELVGRMKLERRFPQLLVDALNASLVLAGA